MSRVTAGGPSAPAVFALAETATWPPALNPAAQQVLTEIELWSEQFGRGELQPAGGRWPWLSRGERFAEERTGVRAAGLGHRPVAGTLHATDRRARVVGARSRMLREWSFGELAQVSALGNWGGLVLVRPGGETELVVAAAPAPSWRDAAGWLKIEAAFAACAGRLELWMADLPHRLAVAAGG
jgi:hypothetical protein